MTRQKIWVPRSNVTISNKDCIGTQKYSSDSVILWEPNGGKLSGIHCTSECEERGREGGRKGDIPVQSEKFPLSYLACAEESEEGMKAR